MAVNPRGGEGASKGSRYIPERLVGPGVIEQNSYIDIAKAKLHIGTVIPVPSGAVYQASTTDNTDVPQVFTGDVGPGDIVRVINLESTSHTFRFTGTGGSPDAIGGDFLIQATSDIITVIPPNAIALQVNGTAGSVVNVRFEYTLDN